MLLFVPVGSLRWVAESCRRPPCLFPCAPVSPPPIHLPCGPQASAWPWGVAICRHRSPTPHRPVAPRAASALTPFSAPGRQQAPNVSAGTCLSHTLPLFTVNTSLSPSTPPPRRVVPCPVAVLSKKLSGKLYVSDVSLGRSTGDGSPESLIHQNRGMGLPIAKQVCRRFRAFVCACMRVRM